jgi:membrane protein
MAMISGLGKFWKLVLHTFREFSNDNCMRNAAALSYYTVFALPAVMVTVISVAGVFADPEDIQGQIRDEISSVIGEEGAAQVQTMIEHADKPGSKGGRTLFGIAIVLVGATGVMGQLQAALNEAWGVSPSGGSAVKNFIFKRLLSLAIILAVAFVLVVSLVMDTVLVAFGRQIAKYAFPQLSERAVLVANVVGTYLLFAMLFAVMYKYLPDAEVAWRNVWLGAAITAVLFVVGKWLLSYYLANHDVGSSFGRAGSLALILVWIYYSGIIFLFGAEFTQVWSDRDQIWSRPEDSPA